MDSPSSSSIIGVEGNDLLVNGATSANTVVASDYVVIITVTPPSDSSSSRSASRREIDIEEQLENSFAAKNVKTQLKPEILSESTTSVLDLNQMRTDRVDATDGRPQCGYHVTLDQDQKHQAIILSSEYNIIDLAKSKHDQVIVGVGKRDRIQLGKGDDVVDVSGAKGSSSAYTGKGNDTVYSGKGDFINTDKGDDQIIALGRSFVNSGPGQDNHAIKNKAMATISSFTPGDDILQSSSQRLYKYQKW